MNDIEIDATDGLYRPPTRTPFKMNRFVVAFVAVLGTCWLGLSSHSTRSATCAVCRMDRVDHKLFGLNWADQEETECSRWYRENVEPAHDHLWVRGGYCRRFGIPGIYGGYACSIGSPIYYFSRSTQMEIYRHFENRLEAKQIFVDAGRLDGGGYGKLQVLTEWVGEGYPGPWNEWWESHRVNIER